MRGWFRWLPSRNPSVILNNKDQPPRALRIRFPGNHLLLLEAIASLQWPSYPSTPATCPGNDHRPGPAALVFSPHRLPRFRITRHAGETERGARKGKLHGGRKETEDQRDTHVHTLSYSCVGYFRPRSLPCSLVRRRETEIALNHSRKPSRDRFDRNCHRRRICQWRNNHSFC